MSTTIEATFDGDVFRPNRPVPLSPNTQVRLTVESMPATTNPPTSFLRTARELGLQGPPDWASNFHEFGYDLEIR
jgi:predicted DNA-binding antitoxin AbrB/MazE fold protein